MVEAVYSTPSYYSGKIGCDRRDIRGQNFFHSFPLKNLYDLQCSFNFFFFKSIEDGL